MGTEKLQINHDAARKDSNQLHWRAYDLREIATDVALYGEVNLGRTQPVWNDELTGPVTEKVRNAIRGLRDIADNLDELSDGIARTSELYRKQEAAEAASQNAAH